MVFAVVFWLSLLYMKDKWGLNIRIIMDIQNYLYQWAGTFIGRIKVVFIFSVLVISWFLSPVLSGLAAVMLYSMLKWIILSQGEKKKNRALIILPFFYAIVIFLNVFSVLFTGSRSELLVDVVYHNISIEKHHLNCEYFSISH